MPAEMLDRGKDGGVVDAGAVIGGRRLVPHFETRGAVTRPSLHSAHAKTEVESIASMVCM